MKYNKNSAFEKPEKECPNHCAECPYFSGESTCTANGCKTTTYFFSRPTDRPLPLPLNCFWWYAASVWNKVNESQIDEYREERLHLFVTWKMLKILNDIAVPSANKTVIEFIKHVHRRGGYNLIDFSIYPEAKEIYNEIKKMDGN